MKTFFILLLLTVSHSFAQVEESCCFCVADPSDPSTLKECQRWFKDNRKPLSCNKEVTFASHNDVKFEPGLSCRKVTGYGANHGNSYYSFTVFQFAQKAARALSPSEVSYDGSTCLVFNNTDVIEREARALSLLFPNVKFELSGNQNEGVVRYLPIPVIGTKPKEDREASSKLTVHAEGGLLEMVYGACSKPKGMCGFVREGLDPGATTDSNAKICMQDNEQLTQSCCEPKKGSFGKWSVPGMDCGVQ